MNTQPTLTPSDLAELRSQTQGTILVPDDAAYAEVSQGWNLAIRQSPALVSVPESIEDVQATVRFAAAKGLLISVMPTGHGVPREANGAVMIRPSKLMNVNIDAEKRTATVGAGVKWGEVAPLAQPHGLAPLAGSSPTVGAIGYTLGGGYNLLFRKYGPTVDHVRSFKVVLADGRLVTASAAENPDLFWALRGGGGAFGVVVEIEVGLHTDAHIYAGASIFPSSRAPEVWKAYAEWTKTVPEAVTSSIAYLNVPDKPFIPEPVRGKSLLFFTGIVGAPEEEAVKWLAPMRSLGPVMDTFQTMPYTSSAQIYNDPADPIPNHMEGVALRDFTPDMVASILGAVGPIPESPVMKLEVRHIGGAMSRAEKGSTPLTAQREAQYLMFGVAIVHPGNPVARIKGALGDVFRSVGDKAFAGPATFLGEGDVATHGPKGGYSSEDLARLRQVKKAYDPNNLFRFTGLGAE